MLTLPQFALTKIAEEAAEVAQIALKAQQFGLYEKKPDQPLRNIDRLQQEVNDLAASVKFLNSMLPEGVAMDEAAQRGKIDRIHQYLAYSQDLRMVESE